MSGSDSSAGGRLGDGRFALATDRPETMEQLRETVVARVAQGHALYPQGGGTALDYGEAPRDPGVAIDTRALSRVIDYPSADMTITIEAGISLATLRNVLAERRQRLLVDAPHAEQATLGGIYATNTNGSRRFGAGSPRDQIIGVSFVTSEGSMVKGGGRVVKNVAGYDFPKLLTGSMGTLGIISQMTLKVRPQPEASALVWAVIPQGAGAGLEPILQGLNTSETRPIALDFLNVCGARHVGQPLGLPSDHAVLVLGFEDNASSVAWQRERLKSELQGHELVVLENESALPLWNALTEFQAAELGPMSFVANVRLSSIADFVQELDPSLWAVQAHAGNGIIRAHSLGSPEQENLKREIDRLRAKAVQDGGNLILPRCPTDWKQAFKVWGERRVDWLLAERVKRALDPKGVMNSGRFVGTI